MKQTILPVLAIIIPCFNEQEVINKTCQSLLTLLTQLIDQKKISSSSFLYFVDDGSSDATWEMILTLNAKTSQVKGLKLVSNCGHQNALYAGMVQLEKQVDCLISIDADLQDDEQLIPEFVDKFTAGYEIVYGVRRKRECDSFFKKSTAFLFYKIMHWFGAKIIPNHADYRLITSKVIKQLTNFTEYNLFLRGIFPTLGFKSTRIYYNRKPRLAGTSKYPLVKMLVFSLNGITSFSVAPLRLISLLGLVFFLSSCLMSIYIIFAAEIFHKTIPGWASTVLPIYFIGGVQLLSIGVMGEYIGKIYQEAKARPRFIIDNEIV